MKLIQKLKNIFKLVDRMKLFIFSLKTAKYSVLKFRKIYDFFKSLKKSTEWVRKPEWCLLTQKEYIGLYLLTNNKLKSDKKVWSALFI